MRNFFFKVGVWAGLFFNATSVMAEEWAFKPYGFIHANVTGASRGLDSFGNTNLSATTAVTPSSVANSDRARNSFQVAQSRLGTFIEYGRAVGHFEIDFIDFTKASPTTQALPRLRIANIDYKIDENQTLSLGQDWDLFAAPAKPFTYNIVGLYFHTGNVGFMKHQIRYQNRVSPDWTLATAVGLVTKNSTASDSEIEMTGLPTVSALVSHRLRENLEIGLTGMGGAVRPAAYPADLAGIYGVNSFLKWESESGLKLREAFYYGVNLASAGTLSLANASASGSHREIGGYITALLPLSESFSIRGGIGASQILEDDGSPLDLVVGNNIFSNWKVEAALTYQPQKQLEFYIQPTFMKTIYVQNATNHKDALSAVALQAGAVFQF